jgi:hypothetical protein
MPLNCQFTIAPTAEVSGQPPPPTLALAITNPGSTSVTVTGVEVIFADRSVNPRPAATPPSLPLGVGQSAIITAGTTSNYGPFPLSTWSAAVLDPLKMMPPDSSPLSTQGFPQFEVWVAGLVYGSDGSVNVAGRARLLLALPNAPTRTYLGGNADFSAYGDSPLTAAVL